ncbi:eukaryotic aspartyl protease family protein [Actinidia rufa]|uniref:Eukaryotic aspartyl protease family protein n=1 Tax=Actinidia rufa TaxID=165716 RepID=A0A7J0EN59_9ERIC|nr:eukaryotic aspartyl protease family protein [Actinidia rufa]
MASSSNCASILDYYKSYYVLLTVLIVAWGSQRCEGFGTFGYDIYHRDSDPVKGILDLNGLPEKGTVDYYAVVAHHDHLLRGRNLASAASSSAPLTFAGGNETYRISSLGFLHYANVSVGSPGLWFLAALDTGSDLFWLPCNCGTNCVSGLNTTSGEKGVLYILPGRGQKWRYINIIGRYDAKNSNTLPINPTNSSAVPPASTVEPEATSGGKNGSPINSPSTPSPPPPNGSPRLNSFTSTLLVVFFTLFIHSYIILSS